MTRISPIQLDDPRAVSFRTPAGRRQAKQPDRCRHRNNDARCRNTAQRDGYCHPHWHDRARSRALAAIVTNPDLTDTDIAKHVGLPAVDIRRLRWAWRRQHHGE